MKKKKISPLTAIVGQGKMKLALPHHVRRPPLMEITDSVEALRAKNRAA